MNNELSFDFATLWSNIVSFLSPAPSQPLMFNSGLFWVLFIIFLPIYAMLRGKRVKMMLFVVFFSLFFFFRSSGWYFLLLVATSFIDWHLARRIATCNVRSVRKWCMSISIVGSVGILFVFKYTNFFLLTWHDVVGGNFQPWDIIAPIGLSFYTFRTVSYVVDVYKEKLKPTESYLEYLFFLSFFPCLVAGPIVRARDFLPQIHRITPVDRNEIYGGLWLVMLGVVKKAVIADYIAQYAVIVFGNPAGYSGFEELMAVWGYTMQIYCDFSGYSDMAIGLGSIMGFNLGVNFDLPYQSRNITEFWRRWHMSLSFWLRDYVYIPLGGNRKGKVRQYVNLMITMLVGGLWHGAAMRFVLWGALHGLSLCVHKLCMPWLKKIPDNPFTIFISWLFTFTMVSALWTFFAADDAGTALNILGGIVTNFDLAYLPPFILARQTWCILMVIIFGVHFLPRSFGEKVKHWFIGSHWFVKFCLFMVVVQLVISFASADVQPFIYAQF